MKKNLAKRIVLGLLTGAVLMSSSVAWASVGVYETKDNYGSEYKGSLTVGDSSIAKGADANACTVVGVGAYTGGIATNSVVLGFGSRTDEQRVVSVGFGGDTDSKITLGNGVELTVPNTRRIVNVAAGLNANDAVNKGQLEDALTGAFRNVAEISYESYKGNGYDKYAVSVKTLKNVLEKVSVAGGNYVEKETIENGTQTNISENFVVTNTTVSGGSGTTTSVTINSSDPNNPIVMNNEGITVGTNSTRMDGTGFYVWADGNNNINSPHDPADAIAAMNDKGEIKGVNGTFSGNVTAANFVTSSGINIGAKLGKLDAQVQTNTTTIATKADKTYVDTELGKKANQSDLNAEIDAREQADQNLQTQIDNIGGGAIAGLNQRLEKTNAKINKVGAGAAALAALHPLDYDPDDKLTFSAGMGNYAGENAAALGAFYRPNEKFMLSLGGTMGNGENMVNLGLSIGLDKPNGFAKMSKRELIQEVNAVKAENEAIKADNEAMKDQLANADERIAKLEALVAQLASK